MKSLLFVCLVALGVYDFSGVQTGALTFANASSTGASFTEDTGSSAAEWTEKAEEQIEEATAALRTAITNTGLNINIPHVVGAGVAGATLAAIIAGLIALLKRSPTKGGSTSSSTIGESSDLLGKILAAYPIGHIPADSAAHSGFDLLCKASSDAVDAKRKDVYNEKDATKKKDEQTKLDKAIDELKKEKAAAFNVRGHVVIDSFVQAAEDLMALTFGSSQADQSKFFKGFLSRTENKETWKDFDFSKVTDDAAKLHMEDLKKLVAVKGDVEKLHKSLVAEYKTKDDAATAVTNALK